MMRIAILIISTIVIINGYETNLTNNATNETAKYETNQAVINNNNVACFSGDSQVQLVDGSWKAIGELQPGDLVHAYDGSKLTGAEFMMMLDRQSSMDTIFYTLKTESGHQISLTGLHLIGILASSGTLIHGAAKDVQIGDQLFVLSNQDLRPSPVVEIKIEIIMLL